jgi:heat shock protein HslJ
MIRLLTAIVLLLTPATALAQEPLPTLTPVSIECPMPELLEQGLIDPATIDPRCLTMAGSISGGMMYQMQKMEAETFAIVALTDAGGRSVRVTGAISFTDGRFTGDVGCNRFGADATVAGDGAIRFTSEIYTTLMFCPTRNEAEQLFARIINSGDLRLDRETGVITSSVGAITLAESVTVAPAPSNEEQGLIDPPVGRDRGTMGHSARTDTSTVLALIAGILAGGVGGFLFGRTTADTPIATPKRRAVKRRSTKTGRGA